MENLFENLLNEDNEAASQSSTNSSKPEGQGSSQGQNSSQSQNQKQQATEKPANDEASIDKDKKAKKDKLNALLKEAMSKMKDFNEFAANNSLKYDNIIRYIYGNSSSNYNAFFFKYGNSQYCLAVHPHRKIATFSVTSKRPSNSTVSAKNTTLSSLNASNTIAAKVVQYILGSPTVQKCSINADIENAVIASRKYLKEVGNAKDEKTIQKLIDSNGSTVGCIPLNPDVKTGTVNLFEPSQLKASLIQCASCNETQLNDIYNEAQANFKRTIAKHPYLTQIAQATEGEMKGNKYTSIGKSEYVRDALIYFNKEKRRILESKALNEAQIDGKELIDEIYAKPENLAWEDKDFADCIKAAKKGDQTAIGYIMYIMEPAIVSSYWKNYVGPSGKLGQIKINKDGGLKQSFLSWIGIALKTLVYGGRATKRKDGSDKIKASTLKGFDLSKVTGDPLRQFAVLFRRDLITQATDINTEKKRRGLSGDGDDELSVFSLNDFDGGEDAGERFASQVDHSIYSPSSIEDDVFAHLSNEGFKGKWLDFCQDDELNHGKVTPAQCFKLLLENPGETNLRNLADKVGCSRNSFQTYCQKAVSILKDYDLSYQDLMQAIDNYGSEKIASYLAA